MTRLKLAVLGCGDVAQRDYLPEIHRLGDRAEIVAICGRTEPRARLVAATYNIPRWFTDYEQMLRESGADALINLTPIQVHYETTIAALEAGMHVYTEKPAATSVMDVRRLMETAEEGGLTLVCAPSVLLFPQVRQAGRLLDEQTVGPVYSARAHGHGGVPPWPGYPSDPAPFFAGGGGPAMDMGVYPLHALTGLLGPVRRVVAMTARAQDSFVVPDGPARDKRVRVEVDDNWHLCLDLGSSRIATVTANNVARGSLAPQFELFGLRGTIAVDLLDVAAPVQVLGQDGSWRPIPPWPEGRKSGPDHFLGVEHLVECVQTGVEPVPSIEHALHVVEVIEKAQRSSDEGRAMHVSSTFGART
jgi:predicted dehydrogenase